MYLCTESPSGNVGLDSGAFLLTTELFEHANQIAVCPITGTLVLVGMPISDNWSHVEVRMSIYGQRQLCSNPADMCKSPRKARNVTRRIFLRLFPAGHETTPWWDRLYCIQWSWMQLRKYQNWKSTYSNLPKIGPLENRPTLINNPCPIYKVVAEGAILSKVCPPIPRPWEESSVSLLPHSHGTSLQG